MDSEAGLQIIEKEHEVVTLISNLLHGNFGDNVKRMSGNLIYPNRYCIALDFSDFGFIEWKYFADKWKETLILCIPELEIKEGICVIAGEIRSELPAYQLFDLFKVVESVFPIQGVIEDSSLDTFISICGSNSLLVSNTEK